MKFSPLLTDLYQLTMMAGFLKKGLHNSRAVFDLYFRKNPFNGGYAVFAGLEPVLKCLEKFSFSGEDLTY